jgi:transposase-like protein
MSGKAPIGTPWQTRFEVAEDGTVRQIRERTLTVCANGHALTAANVVIRSERPVCLTCERTRSREYAYRTGRAKGPRTPRTLDQNPAS